MVADFCVAQDIHAKSVALTFWTFPFSYVLTLFLVPITSLIGTVTLWFRQFGGPLSSSMRLITLSSVNGCVVVLLCRLSDGYSMNGVVCHIFSSIYRSFLLSVFSIASWEIGRS
jgi:hypothetical protein